MLQASSLLKDRYEIQSVLGEGGMGFVYLALDKVLGGKKVAVKEMAVHIHRTDEKEAALRQFRDEAHLLASLEHPRLVPVTDFFEEGDNAYLVMAFVDGSTLDRVTESRAVPISEILHWIDQICDVFEYLHTHEPPVLFRDMKPSNVMLDTRGNIRLIDFGIARSLDAGQSTSTFLKGAGTAEFAPVEQFGGRGTDARSDIYSLGATMFALLTGNLPPISVDVISGEAEAPAPRALNADIPPGVETIICKAMALRKEDRFQSIHDMRAALRDAVRKELVSAQAPSLAGAPTVLPGHTMQARSTAELEDGPSETRPLAPADGPAQTLARSPALALGALNAIHPAHSVDGHASAAAPTIASAPISAPIAPMVAMKGGIRWLPTAAIALFLIGLGIVGLMAAGWKPWGVPGRLRITSTPPGASVWVGGVLRGVTPLTISGLRGGVHSLRVEKVGMEPQELTFNVESSHTHVRLQFRPGFLGKFDEKAGGGPLLDLTLHPRQGTLVVNATPDGVDLYVDGKLLQSHLARGAQIKLDEGDHVVALQAAGFAPFESSIKMTWKGQVVLDAPLQAQQGMLVIDSHPGQATVGVDGVEAGMSGVNIPVKPGTHSIVVQKAGYKNFSASVTLAAGETRHLDAMMARMTSATRSKPAPKPRPTKPVITDVPPPIVVHNDDPPTQVAGEFYYPRGSPQWKAMHTRMIRILDNVHQHPGWKNNSLYGFRTSMQQHHLPNVDGRVEELNMVLSRALTYGPAEYSKRRQKMANHMVAIVYRR